MVALSQPEHGKARVVIAGAGPAGLVLAYSLVKRGHPVTLLEQHKSFDREFRGELIQPGGLGVFAGLGLLDGVLGLDHSRPQRIELWRDGRSIITIDYDQLHGPYGPPILLPQPALLAYLLDQCAETGLLTFLPEAQVRNILKDGDRAVGVEVRVGSITKEIRAELIVGCDGRFSTVRRKAGIVTQSSQVSADVLWFAVPRPSGWPDAIRMVGDRDDVFLFLPNRGGRLQVGMIIPKGAYRTWKEQFPITWLHDRIVECAPALGDVVAAHLPGWESVTVLAAASEMCDRWWQPGLLLIGDAAHVMSPVAGQGINVALQDAAAAAAHLSDWLEGRSPLEQALRAVEQERRPTVAHIQKLQGVAAKILTTRGPIARVLSRILPPLLQRLGVGRKIQWAFAYGNTRRI